MLVFDYYNILKICDPFYWYSNNFRCDFIFQLDKYILNVILLWFLFKSTGIFRPNSLKAQIVALQIDFSLLFRFVKKVLVQNL